MPTSTVPVPLSQSSNEKTRLIVHLSNDLVDKYVGQGESLESTIQDRLRSCVNHTAQKCIYINDEQRQEIEVLLNKQFLVPAQLIDLLKSLLSIRIGKVDVTLTPELIDRLRSRHFEGSFESFLTQRVLEGLELYCGMR